MNLLEIEKFEREHKSLQSQILSAQKQLGEFNDLAQEIKNLLSQREELRDDIVLLGDKKREAESVLEKVIQHKSKIQEEISLAEHYLNEILHKSKLSETDHYTFLGHINLREKELEDIIHSLNQKKKELQVLEEQCKNMQGQIADSESVVHRARLNCEEKNEELKILEEKTQSAKEKYSSLLQDIDEKQKRISFLQQRSQQIEDSQKHLGALQQDTFTNERKQIEDEWNKVKEKESFLQRKEDLLGRKALELKQKKNELELLKGEPIDVGL